MKSRNTKMYEINLHFLSFTMTSLSSMDLRIKKENAKHITIYIHILNIMIHTYVSKFNFSGSIRGVLGVSEVLLCTVPCIVFLVCILL